MAKSSQNRGQMAEIWLNMAKSSQIQGQIAKYRAK